MASFQCCCFLRVFISDPLSCRRVLYVTFPYLFPFFCKRNTQILSQNNTSNSSRENKYILWRFWPALLVTVLRSTILTPHGICLVRYGITTVAHHTNQLSHLLYSAMTVLVGLLSKSYLKKYRGPIESVYRTSVQASSMQHYRFSFPYITQRWYIHPVC